MNFQSIIKFLLPKEDKFFLILEKQALLTYETAKTLAMFTNDNITISTSVQDLEHEGDSLVTHLEEELAKTFVTPIDREDIHKLSIELDDIIDFCNQAARSAVLFKITEPTMAMDKLANLLVQSTSILNQILPSLRKGNFEDFYKAKVEIKEIEKQADKIYRAEINSLVTNENNFKSLYCQKEVLDKLENAIDRSEDILQLLVNLAVKHG